MEDTVMWEGGPGFGEAEADGWGCDDGDPSADGQRSDHDGADGHGWTRDLESGQYTAEFEPDEFGNVWGKDLETGEYTHRSEPDDFGNRWVKELGGDRYVARQEPARDDDWLGGL